jgi:hypothetical protein
VGLRKSFGTDKTLESCLVAFVKQWLDFTRFLSYDWLDDLVCSHRVVIPQPGPPIKILDTPQMVNWLICIGIQLVDISLRDPTVSQVFVF